MADFSWVPAVASGNPIAAIWGIGKSAITQKEAELSAKVAKDLKDWKCETATIEDLSPRQGMAAGALKGLSSGFKSSVCKSIANSSTAKTAEAFRFVRDIMTGVEIAVAVGGIALLFGVAANFLPVPIKLMLPQIMSFITSNAMMLLNFNIQASDQELDAQNSRFVGLAGQAGSVVGQSLGWLACGIAPTAGLAIYNPAQASLVLKEVGEEAIEEISGELMALARTAQRQLQRAAFGQAFKMARAALKDPNNPLYPMLVAKFGKKTIDDWGKPGNKPWTINNAVEEYIETYKSPEIQAFLEEAWEEFQDGCMEASLTFATAYSTQFKTPGQKLRRVSWMKKA